MLELLIIASSYLGYRYAVARGMMQPIALLGGSPDTVIAELETYMPDATKAQVLAALGSVSDPATLMQMASSYAAYYPAAAYSLQHRAWQLSGKPPPEPQPPTAAQMTVAQAAWMTANPGV